jgi:hypothetical protein
MFRLKQGVRLLGVAGMTALLLWLTAGYPVVSRQVQLPTRSDIVQGLEQQLAVTLVAAEGDIFDVENAIFYSDPDLLSVAFIPLHPSSRSLELMPQLVRGEVETVPFGSLYLEGDWPGLPQLIAGFYNLKLKANGLITAVPSEDPEDEIVCGCWKPGPIKAPRPDRIISSFSVDYSPQAAATVDSISSISAAFPWLLALAIVADVATLASLGIAIYILVTGGGCR